MPETDAENTPYNPFDLTKVWPYGDYPPIEVGEMELNCNPDNYFAEVELAAFSPSNKEIIMRQLEHFKKSIRTMPPAFAPH